MILLAIVYNTDEW